MYNISSIPKANSACKNTKNDMISEIENNVYVNKPFKYSNDWLGVEFRTQLEGNFTDRQIYIS